MDPITASSAQCMKENKAFSTTCYVIECAFNFSLNCLLYAYKVSGGKLKKMETISGSHICEVPKTSCIDSHSMISISPP